jgi:hypothetical protein
MSICIIVNRCLNLFESKVMGILVGLVTGLRQSRGGMATLSCRMFLTLRRRLSLGSSALSRESSIAETQP